MKSHSSLDDYLPSSSVSGLLEPLTSGGDDLATQPFYDALAACADIQVSQAHETFRPMNVDGYEARLLNVPSGTAIFAVELEVSQTIDLLNGVAV